jgi:fatty acid desaturase
MSGEPAAAVTENEVTHRTALAALSPADLNALRQPANLPGLMRLASHLGALLATGTLIMQVDQPWLLPPLMIVHGILLVFLFTAEHEAIHGTAFASAWINTAVAELTGFLTLTPPRYFRFFHFAHHRHTQDPAHDPELASPRPDNWRQYLWALTGIPRWSNGVRSLMTAARGREHPAFVPAAAQRRIVWEARCTLTAYALLAAAGAGFGWSWLLWLWIVPSLLGQPFLRAYLLAEHAGCPLGPNMLRNTRTTFTSPLIHWLAWNMPHHTAHHAVPTVPFHRLPQLTAILAPHLASTADGYLDAQSQIVARFGKAPDGV